MNKEDFKSFGFTILDLGEVTADIVACKLIIDNYTVALEYNHTTEEVEFMSIHTEEGHMMFSKIKINTMLQLIDTIVERIKELQKNINSHKDLEDIISYGYRQNK